MDTIADEDGSSLVHGWDSGSSLGAVRRWIDATRVRGWAHFLLLPLAMLDRIPPAGGAVLAAGRGVVSAFVLLAFGYLLNGVADRGMDLDSRKNRLVRVNAPVPRASLTLLPVVAVLVALAGPWPVLVATLACLGFGWIYSVGPRIKALPVVGSLCNLGNFTPLLFVGMRDAALPARFAWIAVAFGGLLLQNQLIHEACDAVEDRRGGVRSTWLTVGPTAASVLASIAGAGVAIAAAHLVAPSAHAAIDAREGFLPLALVATVPCFIAFVVGFPVALAVRGADAGAAGRLRRTHRLVALCGGAALFAASRLV